MNTINELKTFNQLYTDYHERFVNFAFSYVCELAVAEDIASDSMMYYWERRQTLPDETNIPAYILTTIKHKCINYLEHLRVREEYSEKMLNNAAWELNLRISTLEACNPEELFSKEMQETIDRALATLPEQTSTIFRLSRYENKSHKEIADMMDVTTKTVEYHITKSLTNLRKILQKYFDGNL